MTVVIIWDLSPEGRYVAYPVGVQMFLLLFCSSKGDVYQSSRGLIDTLFIYNLTDRILDFQDMPLLEAFLKT